MCPWMVFYRLDISPSYQNKKHKLCGSSHISVQPYLSYKENYPLHGWNSWEYRLSVFLILHSYMPLLSKFLFFGYVYALMADLLIRCLSLANNKNISYIDQSTLVFHDSALFGARNVYPWYDRHFIVCVCECSVVEVFFPWCLWLWTVLCWLFGLPPAHNIFRSYITEDTLCFSFFLCLCEVMVSKLGCTLT